MYQVDHDTLFSVFSTIMTRMQALGSGWGQGALSQQNVSDNVSLYFDIYRDAATARDVLNIDVNEQSLSRDAGESFGKAGSNPEQFWLSQNTTSYDAVRLHNEAGVHVEVQGTSLGDVVLGSVGDEVINGRKGDDALFGGGGDDYLVGSVGDDSLYGGEGDDRLIGGSGRDVMMGGAGEDHISGHRGRDYVEGGAGDDRLYGYSGMDTLVGGEGRDALYGGSGRDALYGGVGNDAMRGGSSADTLYGGEGDDHIKGDSGADVIIGGAGRDVLYGGAESDVFIFESASDSQRRANDVIEDFEAGVDKIDVSALGFDDLYLGGGGYEYDMLRLSYSAASDRTYVRNDDTGFDVALQGDFRDSLSVEDFVF